MSWIATKPLAAPPAPMASVGYLGSVPKGEVRAPDYGVLDRQAFEVHMAGECPPLRTHFHAVDQFQLFTAGSGRFANHDIAAGAVHYADRHTPYGPLRPGPDGVVFLTLRSTSSAGAFYMPEGREALAGALAGPTERDPGERRNLSFDVGPAQGLGEGGWHDLRRDPDGLRIAAADITPDAPLALEPVGGDGGYLAVISGDVVTDEGLAPAGSIRWCDPGDHGEIAAGPDGLRVVLLQLPARPAS